MRIDHEKEVNQLQKDLANLLDKFNEENSSNEENIEKLKMGYVGVQLDIDSMYRKREEEYILILQNSLLYINTYNIKRVNYILLQKLDI